jgi:basic membrane protein A
MIKRLIAASALALSVATTAYAEPVKVGFVYVGPIGDHGWTYRHDIGRQQVEEAYGDKVETTLLKVCQKVLMPNV